MDLFPFFAFFICAHYAANQNENSFVDFIDVAVGTTKPTFIYEKFQSFTIENFSFVDIPFAPFTYHREQKSCAGRYAQKIPVEIGKIALGTDTLCDQSERPTNEIKKGSNNVDNQSANVLKKTNNNGRKRIDDVAVFAKASERFLNNNENLVHLILLAVFLLLTKKLFLGRF